MTRREGLLVALAIVFGAGAICLCGVGVVTVLDSGTPSQPERPAVVRTPHWEEPTTPARTAEAEPAPYYRSCAEVRAAGKAPIRRGQPGYRPGLDRDGDGVACDT